MSLFNGKKGLKHQFAEVLWNAASFIPANNLTNALLFMTMDGTKFKFFIDNLLNAEVAIYLEHAEAYKQEDYTASPTSYRLLFTKVAGGQTLNYTVGESPQIQFDPGTKVWIHHTSLPTSGKFKINAW
jgi:hypothetical protein